MQIFSLFRIAIFGFLSCFPFTVTEARENVTDWYIKDFRAEFAVYSDSTMMVTEWITADCGNCVDKHGIFRVLPTVAHTPEGEIETPVEMVSITDFSGKPHKFEASENSSDDTVTWKIGDSDKTVTGINEYKIVYQVRNVIHDQKSFHEWYWNVVGNFWTLPIDAFSATILLPEKVNKTNTIGLSVYSGGLGNTKNTVAEAVWTQENMLEVRSNRGLLPGEGITLSLSFVSGIFTPYQFSWWELYGNYLWFLIPLIMLVFLYHLWRKYGDDPEWDKPIIPEYEMPGDLNALTMGSLMKNGRMASEHVTAALIELAVKGVIIIRKETEKILFFNHEEFTLEKHLPVGFIATPEQTRLLEKVFETGDIVKLSDLKRKFHLVLPEITKLSLDSLVEKGLVERTGFTYRSILFGVGIGSIFLFSFFGGLVSWQAVVALGATAGIFILVSLIMPKRTLKGVETYAKIKGLKLYMETAEKYRQQFHEKEGLFETLLPVAILFGMTKEWIKKMETIYGKEYFATHHPAWFVGSTDSFDTSSFISEMESVSSSIASNMGTSSGSSGGGSSGGGGGGGGGGGW